METVRRAFQDLIRVLAENADTAAQDCAPCLEAALLDELEACLGENDFGAAATFQTHATSFLSVMGDHGKRLSAQIHLFDFKAALTTLRDWREGQGGK
jgi:hypothetical protein